MTTRRKPRRRTVVIRRTDNGNGDGPSFGTVSKWVMGIISGLLVAAIIGICTRLWNMSDQFILMQSAIESNTIAIKNLTDASSRVNDAQENSIARLRDEDSRVSSVLAAIQVQIPAQQTVQSSINSGFADRIRIMEQRSLWGGGSNDRGQTGRR